MVATDCLSLRAPCLLPQISHGSGVSPHHPSPCLNKLQRDSVPTRSSSSSPSSSRISPAVLFVIVILAVIFFVSGLLHLILRFVIRKRHAAPSSRAAAAAADLPGSDALQRQLQQLFHLHDCGLDQALIDALPVFLYRDIVGSKEPFDCAVCLCEFDGTDELRLLPVCGHAFHLACIDTWLLSNSTCPLCRGSLFLPGLMADSPVFDLGDLREEREIPGERAAAQGDDIVTDKKVFPVRLGKFKNLVTDNVVGGGEGHGNEDSGITVCNVRREEGETSSSNLDARRCFSMGSYQYVVADANLQVAFKSCSATRNGDARGVRGRDARGNCTGNESVEGKRLSIGGRRESFSVSKIWLWSNKKGKAPISSDVTAFDANLPWKAMAAGD
ncbi:unnamed protein product [Musa acuminata subsp. burmannicoides]